MLSVVNATISEPNVHCLHGENSEGAWPAGVSDEFRSEVHIYMAS